MWNSKLIRVQGCLSVNRLATIMRNLWHILLISSLCLEIAYSQGVEPSDRYAIKFDMAGPPSFLLRWNGSRLWRASVGFEHRLAGKSWLGISHSLEFMRYGEKFYETWYFQHPLDTCCGIDAFGDLGNNVVLYVVGLPLNLQFGTSGFGLFLEPRLALGIGWGRKRAHLLDAGRDYDVMEAMALGRLRGGIRYRFTSRIGIHAGAEVSQLKFMGSGSMKMNLLPTILFTIYL